MESCQHVLQDLTCCRPFEAFQPAQPDMFGDIDQSQSNQAVGRMSSAAIQPIMVFAWVAAFHAITLFVEGLEAWGTPGNLRQIAGIGVNLV